MNRRWHIGIDLGLNGAICIMDITKPGNYDISYLEPMPVTGKFINWDELYLILNEFEGMNGILVFEKLGQIFRSSKATAMSMGRQSEGMRVMCKCLGIPYREVPPKEWQGVMFRGIDKIIKKGGKGIDTKAMALEKVRQIYPNLKLTFKGRAVKPHDGLIDAVLLTTYAKLL